MKHLDVWLTFPDSRRIHAAEIVISDPDPISGGLQGAFRYTRDFLNHPLTFALDPAHLPLTTDEVEIYRPHAGIPAVIEDALPDDWGRQLLIRRHRLTRQRQRVPELLARLGAGGLGALAFSEAGEPAPLDTSAQLPDLDKLLAAAQLFEAGELSSNDELALLFQAGSSPGGARPKALIKDQTHYWIAKFPSVKDRFDMVALEAATLTLAQQAGLEVPEHHVIPCANQKALLLRRFDVTGQGRRHMLSLQSLMGLEGYYQASYQDLADAIRLYSTYPDHDLPRLYRQMVFNIAIGNTDDHLKNFTLLHDNKGWHLAPAYDLLPNINQNLEHVLSFGITGYLPKRKDLHYLAKSFGLGKKKSVQIIDAVKDTVGQWQQIYTRFDLPATTLAFFNRDIQQRLKDL
jgi:serine/threonine-protein kinase HipA